jgi:transketolase
MSKSERLAGSESEQLAINTIRFLAVDAVQKADSGHPGLPMGAAPMAYVLWQRFLRHSPVGPHWFDRDRFVLSAGHGSMLLYSLLHLTGYELPLDQLKRFRQWGSTTPGHPERGLTKGVETTTGPLGQGFANAVGMAIAEAHLAARYNKPGFELVSHFTYALVSDGDLMEGVASEAASLAGHLRLGKLICLYDDNRVTLAASTGIAFTEDSEKRFAAYGWHTESVRDGNDLEAIERALRVAQAERDRPSLILVSTHIGYGAPEKQDTFEAHGSPLGESEVARAKKNLGWPLEPTFYVPDSVAAHFREAIPRGEKLEASWNALFVDYRAAYPELGAELELRIQEGLPQGWDAAIPRFAADPKGMATRVAGGKVLQAISAQLPSVLGGSADLDPSTHTELKNAGDFQSPKTSSEGVQGAVGGGWSYAGRNLHLGVREHAMGSIANGLAAHGGIIPFTATFLTFSDYMRPAIRLAALMEMRVIFVFTHDSIGLGEDGPTHQPVEHLAALRAIPQLIVIRPADANETAAAWRFAIESRHRPVAIILSRQNLPVMEQTQWPAAEALRRGAYVLSEPTSPPQLILIGTGSEVSLVLGAERTLRQQGVHARVVSMPSWELFEAQSETYRSSVLSPEIGARLVVEAASPQGWHRYAGPHGEVMGIEKFGASAPGSVVMREYGYTVEHVCERAHGLLAKVGGEPRKG